MAPTPRSEAMPTTIICSPRGRARRSRLSFLVAVALNYSLLRCLNGIPPVQCLLPRAVAVATTPSRLQSPSSPTRVFMPPVLPPKSRRLSPQPIVLPTSSKLYIFFDKFIHPYGVNHNDALLDRNNNNNEGMVELIDALLPRLRTKEDKSRILEGFQRARLDEQLRLSKLSRRGDAQRENNIDDIEIGGDDQTHIHREEERMTRMTDFFQQARLAEQLRLSMNRRRIWEAQTSGCDHDGTRGGEFIDKDEAIHRALLEERLRIRRAQQQSSINCSSDSIERAMAEYEIENEKERSKTLQLAMVQENSNDVEYNGDGGDVDGSDKQTAHSDDDVFVLGATSSGSNNGQHNKHIIRSKLLVNQTEDVPLMQLHDKLNQLRKMVVIATSSSSSSNITWKNATSSMQNLVSTSYLPLPPREDASYISLLLAPVVHLLSAMFLMGSAVFYAVIAVLDVIYNDDEDECSTRACMRTTSHVLRSCWEYLFVEEARTATNWRTAAQRTMRALQTSMMASFYAVQCILMRACSHSKYATECLDAGTGSLRYLVYVIRSSHVLWIRIVNTIQKVHKGHSRNEPNRQTMKLNPLQALTNIRLPFLRPLRKQRTLKDEQQHLRSNEMYNNKLRLLNLDRVNLERERHQLQEARQQLEYEKRQLQAEGVNVLAWYLAARKAAAAAAVKTGENGIVESPQVRKRFWNIWRPGRKNAI